MSAGSQPPLLISGIWILCYFRSILTNCVSGRKLFKVQVYSKHIWKIWRDYSEKKGYYLHLTELLPNIAFIYLFIYFFIYLNAGSHHVAQTGFRLMILCCRLQGTRFTWFCLLLCVWVFAYIVFVDYMCIPGAHRSHRLFPWNWSNKWLLATMWLWESNLGLLEEHLVFLTTESPPQLPSGS